MLKYGTSCREMLKYGIFVAKNWIPRCEPKKWQICAASRLHILSRSELGKAQVQKGSPGRREVVSLPDPAERDHRDCQRNIISG